jgi:hypothetical protein
MKINFATNFTYVKKTLTLHVAAVRIELQYFFIQSNGVEEMFFETKDMVNFFEFKELVGVVAQEFCVVE